MDKIQEPPKKGTTGIVKVVIVLLVLALAGYGGYYLYNQIEWYPTLIVKVSTGINETTNSPTITNVAFEQSLVMYKGADTPAKYPDISIMVRNNSLLAIPVAYWASVPWNQGEESGEYKLVVIFKETYTPTNNDTLILTIRQTGLGAKILNKKTAFYEWR